MKQIVVTVPMQSSGGIEVENFLKKCRDHSSEWIGAVENWEIRSIQVHKDKNDKNLQVTALLENRKWTSPEVKALTGDDVFSAIESLENRRLKIGRLEGSDNCFGEIAFSRYECQNCTDGYNVVTFDGSDSTPVAVSEILKSIGHEPKPVVPADPGDIAFHVNLMKEEYEKAHPELDEYRRELAALPIAIRFGCDSQIAHPLVAVSVGNDNEVRFAINCDIRINVV